MIRVLVVDDSPTMRGLITAALSREPDLEVVGQAAEPHAARAAMKALNPDVVTLDVEMPGMNGLEFLEKIMRLRPTPVVMVSTLTQKGAETTLQALELGAVDCVAKPGHGETFAHLADKVRAAAQARLRPLGDRTARREAPADARYRSDGRLVAIGASTGGVEALLDVLQAFPADGPPTVITQHMPAGFTGSFAARLDRLCRPRVAEATDGALLEPGRIYIAPGGVAHLTVAAGATGLRCRLRAADLVSGHRPSVDVLFHSVAKAVGSASLGVILTGMGKDGASGLLAMREAGAATFGQDEASCIVYGMPRAAYELGAVQRQLPLSRIGDEIVTRTNTHQGALA